MDWRLNPPPGWYPFGYHAGPGPAPMMEFWGEDEDGDPIWERPVEADARPEIEERPVAPMVAQSFEGLPVTGMEGVLSSVRLDMPDGYPVGTHLRFQVEVRVANIRYEEGTGKKRGDFIRKHIFVTETVKLDSAFVPTPAATAPIGNAAGSADLLEDDDF